MAVTVVVPTPNAVTLKLPLVAPAGMVKEAGTVAAPGLLEVKVTLRFAAAAADRVNVMAPSAPVICSGEGESVMTAPTVTWVAVEALPAADAVMVRVPTLIPFKLGWRVGVVWPALKKMLVNVRFAFAVSLTTRLTRSPLGAGAGLANVTL